MSSKHSLMIKLTNILPESNTKISRLHLLIIILFLALFAFPLYPLKVTNMILMLASVLTLIAFFIKPFPIGKIIIRNLVFILPFLPYLFEFCISGFNPTARFEFETKLFFFTAPFFIPVLLQLTGFRNFKLALLIFALSVSVLTLYSIVALLLNGVLFSATSYENGAYLLRFNFERISGLHPTYYSIFALSSACFFFQASFGLKRFFQFCCYILAILLFISVLFLAARIAFITGAIFLFIWIINFKLLWWKKLTLTFSAFALIVLVCFVVPSLKNRLSEIVSWKTDQTSYTDSFSQRTIILDCSLRVFSENILWGTGSRNSQQQLNNCYCSDGWQAGSVQNFNPHNQYLSIGIKYGLVMMLVFITCLFIIFRKIFYLPEGKYFGLAIILFFLSESMLERQMGGYFFGLISLLLYNICYSKTLVDTVHKT